ncbi:MAG: HAMP domain-containing sensor histidine kinase, partial [Planctomycetota bacterium]
PYGTTRWLIRVRWVAVIGQLTSILIVVGPIGLELPVGPLLQIVAFTLLTNVVLARWVGRGAVRDDRAAFDPSPGFGQVCGPIMLVDIATLTGLLYLSGGPGNPFVVFYFVNLCLAAFLLPRPWAWAAAVLATVGVVAIAYVHVPLPALEADDVFPQLLGRDEPATLYQQGSLLAFIACGAVIVTFTGTLREQLRRNEHAMRRVRDELARGQRLDALGTLAAGAAHELANPLGTVAVVIGEMQRRLQRDPTRDPDGRLAKDLRLSRDEIDRCRSILDLMLADAGQSLGETPTEATVGELIEEVLDGVREVGRVEVVCDDATDALRLEVPIVGLGQAFRGLVRNAIAASPDEAAVVLRVAPDGPTRIRVSVEDRGSGMPPEVLKKAGEPFFTTKEAGKGTGLGLFLARAVVEWLGGTWSIASKPGEGTTVAATIPVSASRF